MVFILVVSMHRRWASVVIGLFLCVFFCWYMMCNLISPFAQKSTGNVGDIGNSATSETTKKQQHKNIKKEDWKGEGNNLKQWFLFVVGFRRMKYK